MPPLRGRILVAAAVLLVVAGGTGAGLLLTGRDASPSGPAPAPDVATVSVVRGDLRQATQVTGELGYGAPVTVTGRGPGIVTWLPSAGLTVRRGEQLYRVDDSPVAVLYGDLPLYRTLTADPAPPERDEDEDEDRKGGDDPPPDVPLLTGNDVDLVATNLAALGLYGGTTEDATYGSLLAGAVADWQEARGLEGTGVLEPGEVVVVAGAVRVDAVTAQVGADAAADVLTVTSTRRSIVLQASPDLARSLAPGRRVRVSLADGRRLRTRIVSIGGRATSDDESGGPPTVAVVVEAARAGQLADAVLGPVTASITTAARKDVLQVPVTALLTLAGGGHAVERSDGTLVPVTLGMVADGLVEVTGLEDGDTVVVAS